MMKKSMSHWAQRNNRVRTSRFMGFESWADVDKREEAGNASSARS